jgi:hypothetical protein
MLRGDGRLVTLSAGSDGDDSMTAILAALLTRVRGMRVAEGGV